MSNYRLGVEVISAHDLMPKDRESLACPCVELRFDGQKFRTTIKERDLNPVWNERFYFNISDLASLPDLALEAYVYNVNQATRSRSSLGKVRLAGASFDPFSDAMVKHYPLEKRGVFSRVKGELGLKFFLTDDPCIKPSNPFTAIDPFPNNPSASQVHPMPSQVHDSNPSARPENHSESRHISQRIPMEVDQNHLTAPASEQPGRNVADHMKSETSKIFRTESASSHQPVDYALKETSPHLGPGQVFGGHVIRSEKPSKMYDLVEHMVYLFVRVVKARDLPTKDVTGRVDPYVEVKLGNYKGITKHYMKQQNPEWNDVFAFSGDRIQSSLLQVSVRDRDSLKDDFIGLVSFDLNDLNNVPRRVPPDNPLVPEWYRLKDEKGDNMNGELMLAVWIGTQVDEAFPEAWNTDAVGAVFNAQVRSKVYQIPRLWYLQVNIIEAQDIVMADKNCFPDLHVKVEIGNQALKTRSVQAKTVQARTFNPFWNEDLMFVAAEPFEDPLILSMEASVGPNKYEKIGRVVIPWVSIEMRVDERPIKSRWFSLEKTVADDVDQLKENKFLGRVHLRVCLDGGYHVLDHSTYYSSDFRPTAKELWRPSIGLLDLGILNAEVHPTKIREQVGTSDAYCVAKYGQKWVRTRTVINSLNPRYNEQYTWDVYEPHTVLTVGMFDNCNWQLGEKGPNTKTDFRIGKVFIRLSALETGRVYTHIYPLLVLTPSGVKKMGELHLAVRFSSTSLINMLHIYSCPLLPKMHYIRPLTDIQLVMLRHHAVQIVAARLSRMEPPLRREVVEYMSDVGSPLWSMRRSKVNFFGFVSVFSGLFKCFGDVVAWKNPVTTVLVHILYLMLVFFPEMILPTVFLCMLMKGVWNYWYRPSSPPHVNTQLSHAEGIHPDNLDEEFDTFPTSRTAELVRMRYVRLRSLAGRIQTVMGYIATRGERVQALFSWRDPRATTIFLIVCLIASVLLFVTPIHILAALAGFYVMRHPRFRRRTPSAPINFFRRLPALTDGLF